MRTLWAFVCRKEIRQKKADYSCNQSTLLLYLQTKYVRSNYDSSKSVIFKVLSVPSSGLANESSAYLMIPTISFE